MKQTYLFDPVCRVAGAVPHGTVTIAQIAAEQGVYSATPAFMRAHCGPLALSFLDAVPADYYAEADRLGLFVNCDVRVHRLYPGDYPAYPGWHCDGEFRETYFSQPDLDRVPVHRHLIGCLSTHPGGICRPEFLAQPFCAHVDAEARDVTLWGQVHEQVMAMGHARAVWQPKDGELVEFSSWTLHRALPAIVRGWRLFFRMSMWHRPNLGAGGMVSRQEQVYRLAEGGGW